MLTRSRRIDLRNVVSLRYLLPEFCGLSVQFFSCTGLALIDLASVGKQTAIEASTREGLALFGFLLLEVESMKNADRACGRAVAVDRGKKAKTEMALNLDSTLVPLIFGKKCCFAALALLVASYAPAYAASACQPPVRIGETIEVVGSRKVKVVDQTIVDNSAQSTLRQKLLALGGQPITDNDARAILSEMFTRARAGCRRYPLSGVIMFLYGNEDATAGTNWIARLDTGGSMTPVIEVQQALLGGATTASICDGPRPPKPTGKSYRSSDEVDLPPLRQRKVLGTWYQGKVVGATCSQSFEEVNHKVYEVLRCSDCSGGKTGTPLFRSAGGIFTRPDRRNGEYFKILPNGDLASYDRDGHIDTYPKLPGLWP